MNRTFAVRSLLGAVALFAAALYAHAAGIFPGFPTVPSGAEQSFTGIETVPADTQLAGGLNPETILLTLGQLGQGAVVDSTSASAAQTIPNNTLFYVLDTNTPGTVAVTFPAAAAEGQIQRIICGIAVATALTVVANTGQAVKGQPTGTCLAGAGFAWRFVGSTTNSLAAGTWLRFQ
jgi:hypothetical protein